MSIQQKRTWWTHTNRLQMQKNKIFTKPRLLIKTSKSGSRSTVLKRTLPVQLWIKKDQLSNSPIKKMVAAGPSVLFVKHK